MTIKQVLEAKQKDLIRSTIIATLATFCFIIYTMVGEDNGVFSTLLLACVYTAFKMYKSLASYERTFFWGLE